MKNVNIHVEIKSVVSITKVLKMSLERKSILGGRGKSSFGLKSRYSRSSLIIVYGGH